MLLKKAILWEKWRDPLMPRGDDGKVVTGLEQEEDDEDPQYHAARQSFHDCDDDDCPVHNEPKSKKVGPCIYGPQGIIPLHESNFPSRLYNFWMGHTTFDITPTVRSKISLIPGVETLDIFSRYRFRLGVGKAFKQEDVKRAIEQEVCIDPPPTPPKSSVDDPLASMKATLSKQYKHWAIIVLQNRVHQYVGGQTSEEVLEKLKQYEGKTAQIILSWEKK